MLAAMALTLLDWRRRVARLYADVRAAPSPGEGHELWRAGRDRLFAEHPDSPLEPADRARFARLPGLGDLDVWWLESYGGGVFVPVRDPAQDTYGGGRYLLDTVKGADLGGDAAAGHLVLDLNFAYNPSCAYSPAWTCPLAPAGNTLTVPLTGGERYPNDPA